MTEPARAAGVRQEDRLASGKSTAEISKAARSEIQSTVRVYGKQWLMMMRLLCEEDVNTYFQQKYEGRLRDEDWKVVVDADGTAILYVKKWTVLGEWKDARLAVRHAALLAEEDAEREVEVVDRNSRREHVLNSYGVLKLPS